MVTPTTIEPMALEELAALALEWADVAHPDKAAQVRAVQHDAPTFRRWCGRLLELRWREDVEWRRVASLRALQETGLVVQLRIGADGPLVTVSGRYAPRPWRWTFAEVAEYVASGNADGFRTLAELKDGWDLYHVMTRTGRIE